MANCEQVKRRLRFENLNFCEKYNLDKNRNFGPKKKFLTKIESSVKRTQLFSENKNLVKNRTLVKN